MNEYTPWTDKAQAEASALRRIRKNRPRLFWSLIAAAIVYSAWFLLDYFKTKNGLQAENKSLQGENQKLRGKLSERNADIIRLEAQLAPFRTLALMKYPGTESDALKKLETEVLNLQKTFAEEQKTIRTLGASVSMTVSGSWAKDGLRPDTLVIVGNNDPYLTLTSTNSGIQIVLNPTRVYSVKRDDGRYGIEYLATVAVGTFPVGSSTDRLPVFHTCSFAAPMLNSYHVPGKVVSLDEVEIHFYMNGVKWTSIIDRSRHAIEVPADRFTVKLLELRARDLLKSQSAK